jgi:hypothetical protein
MLFTCKPTPPHASVKTCLQIFSIRVTEIDDGLEWPLEVYGLVATRDSVDHNRNIIFRRGRDACQILTEQVFLISLARGGERKFPLDCFQVYCVTVSLSNLTLKYQNDYCAPYPCAQPAPH